MATLEVTAADVPDTDWRARLPRLGTDRVVLRELQPTDAPALYGLVCHSNVVREMWPPPASVEGFEQFIEWTWRERAAGRYVSFGIVPQGRADAVGLFELRNLQHDFFRAELGFVLDPAWWGTGVFGRASRLLFEFAFSVLHVHRIEARASTDNVRSNAALRKVGARHEGVLRSAFAYDGKFFDQNLWAIVAGFDETSPSASDAKRSDTHPRAS
jgi:ribosomal-protein-alanine N-acetyltransferase